MTEPGSRKLVAAPAPVANPAASGPDIERLRRPEACWLVTSAMPPVLVKHIMSAPVVTFFEEQTLPLAEDVMRLHKFRHLPVIDNEHRLVGLITQRDLLRGQISVLTGLTDHERRARQEEIRIRGLMTRDVWTVSPDTLASHAGRTLIDHKYSCLPVVDRDRILCGIVTERDFLRFAIKALELHD